MISLRDYQSDAVQAVYAHLRAKDTNPCVVIPTGGGKTPVIAQICTDAVTRWGGRVCVLAHVKELLEQTAATLQRMAPGLDVGVYSAGLNSRDTEHAVICAGIQSVYKRPEELGAFNLLIVDEAHLIPEDGEGMYRQFIEANSGARVIGLTATPYRTRTGMICGPDSVFGEVCHETGVKELIVRGYLSRLISKAGHDKPDLAGLHTRMGEYVQEEMEAAFSDQRMMAGQVIEIVERTHDRKSVLIFAAGVEHAQKVAEMLRQAQDEPVAQLYGDTGAKDRAETIARFRAGEIKYLVNVAVLTTGFDAPGVDAVVLLRATQSPGLYYQMVGRGFRIAEGKADCLVLDFGQNVVRHGPVDQIRPTETRGGTGEAPAKECERCLSIVPAGCQRCPDCGYEFPPPERGGNLDMAAGSEKIVSEPEWVDVKSVWLEPWEKRGWKEGDPRTIRVRYKTGFAQEVSEWVCPEHVGFARRKFEDWWFNRSISPIPDNVDQAVALWDAGALATTTRIMIEQDGEYERVKNYELGERPEYSLTTPSGKDTAAHYQPREEEPEDEYEMPF